ncbi:hypothetical protein ACFS07_19075 [Undibacterium arcticum]
MSDKSFRFFVIEKFIHTFCRLARITQQFLTRIAHLIEKNDGRMSIRPGSLSLDDSFFWFVSIIIQLHERKPSDP